MTATGGEPTRLTFHPAADQALGWTPDGKILFRSRRDTPNNDNRIYTIPPEGGVPQLIPLEPAAWIAFEPTASVSPPKKSASNSIIGNATRAARPKRFTWAPWTLSA